MDRLDVLNTKLIDLLNRPVKYIDDATKRKRTGRISMVDERGALITRKYNVVARVAWEDLEWNG